MKKNLLFLLVVLFMHATTKAQLPPSSPPPPCGLGYTLTACDDSDNDGFAQFDLSISDALNAVFCPLTADSLSNISYHTSEDDANNNINAITNLTSYTNITNPQTIYVRVFHADTNAFYVESFSIQVFGDPVDNVVADLIGCDDDADGYVEVILDAQNGLITNGLMCTTVSYYVSLSDAENATNPIDGSVPYMNVSNPHSIYFREENEETGNFVTGSFDIIPQLPPVIYNPTELEICDDDNDGVSTFNLMTKNTEIIGGNTSLSVSYFETDVDAQSGINVINPSFAYQNIANPQILYVRVEDNTSGCVEFTTLTISVEQVPTPQTPTPISLCDDVSNDGIETFDLTIRESEIINGEANVSATYFNSLDDAEASVNAISDPTLFVNSTYYQEVYVRITNDITGCYRVVILELHLSIQPIIDYTITPLELCQDSENVDGFAFFNLYNKTSEILGGLDSGFFTVTYYETLNDAENEVNEIFPPNNYYSDANTIYARLTSDVLSDCYDLTQFDLVVNPLPNIDLEDTYDLCNGETLILNSGLDPADYDFSWSTGETTPTIVVTQADTYTLSAVSFISGCQSVASTLVSTIDCSDTDDDGVIDDDEDINDNGDLDDDDTDDDGTPNYLDDDDDGDNVDTSVEINIASSRLSTAQHPFIDTDNDLIENYLDDDDDGDNVLTINEDYNNNGDPTDDDTNMNNIPDYLDSAVTLSVLDINQIVFSLYPNPAKDNIMITFSNLSSDIVKINVFDIQGKIVKSEDEIIIQSKINLDISKFQSGIYFVEINTNSFRETRKLIIE